MLPILEAQIENMEISNDVKTLMKWHGYNHLTCLQVATLLLVQDNPGCSTGAIAEALQIYKPAVTRATQKLVKLGFLTSEVEVNDRRMVKLYAKGDGL